MVSSVVFSFVGTLVVVLLLLLLQEEVGAQAPPPQASEFKLQEIPFSTSIGDVITDIQNVRSMKNRLFVATRGGMIHVVNLHDHNCASITSPAATTRTFPAIQTTPFLDISSKVTADGERGLLGLAFHPEYATNGYFFVHYSNLDSNTTIARYQRSSSSSVSTSGNGGSTTLTHDDILTADPDSEVIMKVIYQPARNHNGGAMQFGPNDGYLYIALGDGGRRYDLALLGQGQNLETYLGKILRVDVDDFTSSSWKIPTNNPFATTPNAYSEIWAYGLRNPWRISFDRNSGDLYIADVGQNAWEEVNYQPSSSTGGENYGWCVCEANIEVPKDLYDHCLPPPTVNFQGCNASPYIGPIFDYPHVEGIGASITGGYVYRGNLYPGLNGVYFYADFSQGFVRGARKTEMLPPDENNMWIKDAVFTLDVANGGVTSFGEDADGELYAGTATGNLYHIRDPLVTDLPSCEEFSPTFTRKKRRETGKQGNRLGGTNGMGGAATRTFRGQ